LFLVIKNLKLSGNRIRLRLKSGTLFELLSAIYSVTSTKIKNNQLFYLLFVRTSSGCMITMGIQFHYKHPLSMFRTTFFFCSLREIDLSIIDYNRFCSLCLTERLLSFDSQRNCLHSFIFKSQKSVANRFTRFVSLPVKIRRKRKKGFSLFSPLSTTNFNGSGSLFETNKKSPRLIYFFICH